MLSASSSALPALLANPALSSVIVPLHLMKNNITDGSKLIGSIRYYHSSLSNEQVLPAEVGLLKWMNESTTEWQKYTRGTCTTIDWRQFTN